MYTITKNNTSGQTEWYRNGVLLETDVGGTTGTVTPTFSPPTLFNNNNLENTALNNATLDEFSTWSRILNSSEISTLYNDGFGLMLNNFAQQQQPAGQLFNATAQDTATVSDQVTVIILAPFDTTDLEAYWKFEETSGNMTTEQFVRITDANSQSDISMTKTATGIIGNAWHSASSGSPIVIIDGDPEDWNFIVNDDTSWNFWYTDGDPTHSSDIGYVFQTLSGLGGSVGGEVLIDYPSSINTQGVDLTVSLWNEVSGAFTLDISCRPNCETFTMVTITKNITSGEIKWYENGTLIETDSPVSTTTDTTALVQPALFARTINGFNLHDSSLDEFSVWSRVLTPTEITNLYNNGSGIELFGAVLPKVSEDIVGVTDSVTVIKQLVSTEDLFAYWKFDNAVINDMISTNPPATIPDGDVSNPVTGFTIVDGVIDTAYKRGTGATGRIELGANGNRAQYDFLVSHEGNDTSYNFWAIIEDVEPINQNQFIFSSWTDDFNGAGVAIVADTSATGLQSIQFDTRRNSGSFIMVDTANNIIPTDNLFHMYTIVNDHDDGTLDWYRDGVLFQSDTGNTKCTIAIINLGQCIFERTAQIGDIQDSSPEHGCRNCTFDEFSIWNRNLTQADITALYNQGKGLQLDDQFVSDLVSLVDLEVYWKFEETSGNMTTEAFVNIPDADSKSDISITKTATGKLGNAWRSSAGGSPIVNIGGTASDWLFLVNDDWSFNFWFTDADPTAGSDLGFLFQSLSGLGGFVGAEIAFDYPSSITTQAVDLTVSLWNESVGGLLDTTCRPDCTVFDMLTVTNNITSGEIKWYQNGTLIETDSPTTTTSDTTALLPSLFARTINGFNLNNATLDEFSIWSRVLTPSEVSNMFRNGSALALESQVLPPVVLFNASAIDTVTVSDVVNLSANFTESEIDAVVVVDEISLELVPVSTVGLEIYYKMDGTSLVNNPISNLGSQGKGNQTAVIGTPTFQVAGIINNGTEADASGDGVLTGNFTGTDLDFMLAENGSSSINFWLFHDQDNGDRQYIFSTTDSLSDDGCTMDFNGILNAMQSQCFPQASESGVMVGGLSATNSWVLDNQFHMWTVTMNHTDGGTQKFYLDGFQIGDQGSTTWTNKAFNSNPNDMLMFNRQNGQDKATEMPMDEFSLWSRILTPNDITNLFNSGAGLELDNQTLIVAMVFNQTEIDTASVLDDETFIINKTIGDLVQVQDLINTEKINATGINFNQTVADIVTIVDEVNDIATVTKIFTDTVTTADAVITSKNPVPNAINDLSAFAVANNCELTWSTPINLGDPFAPINGYGIFSSVDGGLFIPIIANTSNTDTAFNHTGLNALSTYLYNVTAFNKYGTSLSSNIDSCVPQVGSDPPSIPTGLTAVNQGENVFLDWDHDGVGNPTGYKIERALGDGAFFDLVSDTSPDTSTSFLDNTVVPATKFRYRISAINAFGTSDPSQIATITTLFPPAQPTLTAVQDGNMITLTWTEPTSDEPINGYTIDRRINFGSLSTLVANTTTTSLTFDDLNVTKPNVYGYRVNALSILGAGTVSNIVDVVFGSHTTVIVEEQDGSGYKGGGTVRLQNSTFTLDKALDSGSIAIFDNLDSGNYNFTFIDEDNFILNKTFNFPHPTGNQSNTFTISALVFDVDCPSAGTGTDVRIKVNYTDGKDITEYPSTPVCDSSDKVSWSVRWQGDAGVDMSTMIADFISNTFKTNADTFLVSAIQTDTIYNSPLNQIESVDYVVNNNVTTTDVTINFDLFLGQAPPSGGSGGSGGGSPPPAGASIPELKIELLQRLTGLSVLSRTHQFASAGDVIEGSISVEWEGEAPLTVKSIDVGEFSNIIRFDTPPILLAQMIEGSGDFAKSSAEISYLITLPPFICDEMLGITQNCVNEELLSIPIGFVFESEGVDYTASTSVMVDLRPIPFDLPQFQIILLGIVLIVSAIAGNFIRMRIRGTKGRRQSSRARTKKFKKKFDSS